MFRREPTFIGNKRAASRTNHGRSIPRTKRFLLNKAINSIASLKWLVYILIGRMCRSMSWYERSVSLHLSSSHSSVFLTRCVYVRARVSEFFFSSNFMLNLKDRYILHNYIYGFNLIHIHWIRVSCRKKFMKKKIFVHIQQNENVCFESLDRIDKKTRAHTHTHTLLWRKEWMRDKHQLI